MDTVLRTEQPGWQARLEGCTQGEFPAADGCLRRGAEYRIGLLAEGVPHATAVRAFLAEDLTVAARADLHYQAQTVLRYVFERLERGWSPERGTLPPLTIGNPGAGYRHPRVAAPRSMLDRLLRGRPI